MNIVVRVCGGTEAIMDAPYVKDTSPLSVFGSSLTSLSLRCGEKGLPSVLPAALPLLRTLVLPWNTTVKSLGHYPLLESLEVPTETHALVWQKNIPLFSNYPMLLHFDISGFRHLTIENLESMIQCMPRLETIGTHGSSNGFSRSTSIG